MPNYDFGGQRLFVDSDLRGGEAFPATDDQANYLLRVLRLTEGAAVLLFNGRDGEWEVRLADVKKRSCSFVPERSVRGQTPASDLICLFAPLKRARLDYLVQKAVEMGAGVLQPVITEHTQVERIKIERMTANAREAAEQCGVLSLPEVCEPAELNGVLAAWDETRSLVFADEKADVASPVGALAQLAGKPLGILIGPEGGFSPEEQAHLRSLSFVVPVCLGPRIMRADTALVAAMAVLQACAGDWK